MWERLPDMARQTFIANAPTFLDEQQDPGWSTVDLEGLSRYTGPALLTRGTRSPPWFGPIIASLAATMGRAQVRILEGAGHIPHVTHPEVYVAGVTGFIEESSR